MNRYSKERVNIGNDYRDMINNGIKIDESSFINWVMSLYNCDYSTAKQGFNDGVNLIAMQKQAEMSQQVDEDKVVRDLVDNIDNKLSSEEQKVLEVFKDE